MGNANRPAQLPAGRRSAARGADAALGLGRSASVSGVGVSPNAFRVLSVVAVVAAAGAVNGRGGKSNSTSSSRHAVVHRSCPLRDLTCRPGTDPRTATVLVPAQPIGVL